jgi:hypothetical protein
LLKAGNRSYAIGIYQIDQDSLGDSPTQVPGSRDGKG